MPKGTTAEKELLYSYMTEHDLDVSDGVPQSIPYNIIIALSANFKYK